MRTNIIMNAKLTLKLNENIIEKAKKYASHKKVSISKLVENYLDSITNEQKDIFEISPFVKSISNGKELPQSIKDKELQEEYYKFLEKKYQ